MVWWYWILFGVALLSVEILIPGGFYLFFFGLAAVAVGAVAGLGLGEPVWVQWLLFSVLSVASLLLFRGPLLAKIKSREQTGHEVDTMVGETATLLEDLPLGGAGKAESRGTTWGVLNAGQVPLSKGQRTRVERVEGLTLWVKPE